MLANFHLLTVIFHLLTILPPVPPDKSLSVYIGLTCCVEVFEAVGLALSFGSQRNNHEIGKILEIVGLAIQIHNIAAFCVILILFWCRYRKTKTQHPIVPRLLLGIAISMGLISILSVGRLIEGCMVVFKSNCSMPAPSWFAYGIEAGSLLANSLLWNICGWGRALSHKSNHIVQ